MKEELNNYNITNADGTSKVKYANEGKQSFANDKRTFARECFSVDEGETVRVPESFDEDKERGEVSSGSNKGVTSDPSALAASTATTSAATAASSVGGGLGALAGAIASAVATAAIVVAVFVSTLVIDLSLAMADINRLVFEITMQGAQAEDFEDPINAVLTSDDGTYLVQPVKEDTKILTFDDLQAGREYLITIRNSEKVFVEKSFFTATTALAKGNIAAGFVDGEVVISVSNVTLQKGEFYTVYAKDASEKTLFAKDGVEANAEYRFSLAEQKDLYLSLSVKGKIVAMAQLLFTKEETSARPASPIYDFEHPLWSWSEDHLSATVSFVDVTGGSPLILETNIDEQKINPDCENQGKITYTATANYEDRSFRDEAVVVLQAYGHVFYESSGYNATCEEEGMAPHITCAKCGKCFNEDEQEVPASMFVLSPLGHNYGELNEGYPATTESDGRRSYYACSYCYKLFDEEFVEISESDLVLPAYELTYDFDNPVWTWEKDTSGAMTGHATVTFLEIHDEEPLVYEAAVTMENRSHATCEYPAVMYYRAVYESEDHEYYYDESSDFEEGDPLGHTYGTLHEEEAVSCMHEGHKAYYQCSVCEKYFDVGKEETDWSYLYLSPTGHSLSFYPDGETIYVRCDNYCSETFPSLTIEAPTLTVEGGGGSSYATLSGLNEFNLATDSSVSEDDIIYYSASASGILEEAPTTAGVYYASITVYSAVIAIQYEIASN